MRDLHRKRASWALGIAIVLGGADALACGGNGERACCIGTFEYSDTGWLCDAGNIVDGGCSGDCNCGGFNPFGFDASQHCVRPECGGEGERGCCWGAERNVLGLGGPCEPGLIEDVQGGCSGDCGCTGSVFSSWGMCREPTPCGGPGQRACCQFFLEFSADGGPCEDGAVEIAGCAGDCTCGGPVATGQDSLGHCVAIAPCGGPDERACCNGLGEFSNEGDGCDDGLVQDAGCSGNCLCGGLGTGQVATGTCREPQCGEEGQRGCCFGLERIERGLAGPCEGGLVEDVDEGCSGDCSCEGGGTSIGTCRPFTECGGHGNRACCVGTLEHAPGGGACSPGFVQVPGCAGLAQGLCRCGGASAIGQDALGTCTAVTDCGGAGERACCPGTSEHARGGGLCEDGFIPVPGCSGDCTCGGINATGEVAHHTCTTMDEIEEPGTEWSPPANGPACALRGYADMHLHLFSHVAHGEAVVAGKAWDADGGVNAALGQCYGSDQDLVSRTGNPIGAPDCPAYLPDCGAHKLHQNHGLDDAIGLGTGDETDSPLGAPNFAGWPKWDSTTHQQAYYRWLERAWRGGLRLVTVHTSTNEALCQSARRADGTDCTDSMAVIDRQIDLAAELEAFIDAEHGGDGWFRIVRTPAEARAVIGAGKLAVVLGIEVDNLFNCKEQSGCTEDDVDDAVAFYYDRGIRHVFPIHNFDTGFGGTATWADAINVGNRVVEGRWWESEECPGVDGGYGFHLDRLIAGLINFLGFGNLFDLPAPYDEHVSCNQHGLTPLGEYLIEALMDRHMIIDVDHMSNHSLDRTLDLAAARDYPVVAGHVQFFSMYDRGIRHERMRRRDQLLRIRDGGGMIAAMLKDDNQDNGDKGRQKNFEYLPGDVTNDCTHSSKSFAQSWMYAVNLMGNRPIALGSDFNGLAGHVGPRFGHRACGGMRESSYIREQRSAQLRFSEALTYPFTVPGFGAMSQQVTGEKAFDYNVDGLAHIGLLPDFVADLSVVGVTPAQMEPLWRSALGYIETWERSEGTYVPPPIAQCKNLKLLADDTCTARARVIDGEPEQDERVEVTQSAARFALGESRVTVSVKDACGGGGESSCEAQVHVFDATPPVVACPRPQVVECNGPETPVVFEEPGTKDNCGATAAVKCSREPGGGFAVGATAVRCAAEDASGNEGACDFDVRVRDGVAPVIEAPRRLQHVECNVPGGAILALGEPAVADVCDPQPQVAGDAPKVFPMGRTTVRWTATDASGNTARDEQRVTVVDRTAPVVESAVASPARLRPDGRMVPVQVAVAARDACDAAPACRITRVASSEPARGREVDAVITGPLAASLRAESGRRGEARRYTLHLTCTDREGNTARGEATVDVR